MDELAHLFENNRRWAAGLKAADPDFFTRLSLLQAPKYLWLGCSDSRVPANEIVGLLPGQLFVHRNVANLAHHTDLNFLSVLQFAVEELRVQHIIVCGHYNCGGVKAALSNRTHGLADNWLRGLKELCHAHREELEPLADEHARADRVCELNVAAQVGNVARTTIVQQAWRLGQDLTVHGWIYRLEDGLLQDLGLDLDGPARTPLIFRPR